MTKEKLLENDVATLTHINKVRQNLGVVIRELADRAEIHDASKMESPEREIMAEQLPLLGETEYGTEEYKQLLEKIRPALDHHYAKNRHHPEYHPKGVDDMNLLDLLEMICDWRAATQRNKNGNIRKSIEHNAKRFNMSPQLEKIFTNTVRELFGD